MDKKQAIEQLESLPYMAIVRLAELSKNEKALKYFTNQEKYNYLVKLLNKFG